MYGFSWKTFALFTLVAAFAMTSTSVAHAQPKSKAKKTKATTHASIVRISGAASMGGEFGLHADYDLPVINELGPGRVYVAPTLQAYGGFSSENGLARSNGLIGVLGTGRYVVHELHPKIRPWGSLGVGLFWAGDRRELASTAGAIVPDHKEGHNPGGNGNGNGNGNNTGGGTGTNGGAATNSRLGPGVSAGVGVDFDVSQRMLVTVGINATRAAGEGIGSVHLGAAWRF